MIKYDFEQYCEWKFTKIVTDDVAPRGQWLDINLSFELEEGTTLQPDLQFPSATIICTSHGDIVQILLLNEGCDSEYRFTDLEKEQLIHHVQTNEIIERYVSE